MTSTDIKNKINKDKKQKQKRKSLFSGLFGGSGSKSKNTASAPIVSQSYKNGEERKTT